MKKSMLVRAVALAVAMVAVGRASSSRLGRQWDQKYPF